MCKDANGNTFRIERREKLWLIGLALGTAVAVAGIVLPSVLIPAYLGWLSHDRSLVQISTRQEAIQLLHTGLADDVKELQKRTQSHAEAIASMRGSQPDN